MHIVLISQCEHRAIGRTARVLDAYALRQGDRTWMTPITREGLQTLHSILRAGATRQTAVACYVSQGTRQMRLLWVVGAKGRFGPRGEVAVATRSRTRREEPVPMPAGLRAAALLARLSGYLHDLGKFGQMFQEKLVGAGPMADAVRHEWLSLHVVLELQRASGTAPLDQLGQGWDQAWAAASSVGQLCRMKQLQDAGLSKGLRDAWSTLLFLVFTHHRLPDDQGRLAMKLSDKGYVDEDRLRLECSKLRPVAGPSPLTLDLVRKTAARLANTTAQMETDPLYWRAVSTVARMGLILADHGVSGVVKTADAGHGPDLVHQRKTNKILAAFANTVKLPDGSRVLNQELNWHLQNVGNEASEFVSHFQRFDPPGLTEEVLATLRAPAKGRFAWQSAVAAALRSAQSQERMPTLVFNVAGTGSGKTRMNVVAAAALREGDGKVRLATALNLRTLTLQTRDAYAQQIGMSEDELACVIGCSVAQRLHESRSEDQKQVTTAKPDKDWGVDEDGNPPEELFDATGASDPPPPWLEHFLERKPRMRSVVMAPVLVCTADHLIKAGEPTEQGNYALTNLRLMTSDLVLDEVDSYDPKALAAIMRLITAAAFWGRHVIASSATQSLPLAHAVWDAYRLGAEMRSKLLAAPEHARFRVAMIDDRCPARLAAPISTGDFDAWFASSLQSMLQTYGLASYRPAELAKVDFTGRNDVSQRKAALLKAIEEACSRMHGRHQWNVMVDGRPHRISLGLVRIANIKQAVKVAEQLSAMLPGARIACYHSQLPRIARFMLERTLDEVLTRKSADGGPSCSPAIQDAVRRARNEGRSETMFVVVATAVEEIGRDHDFDWAVIEPSSAQSIVQTVGRVNRHRLQSVDQPNVAVLQFNFKHAVENVKAERGQEKACFLRPGLESESQPYGSHDMCQLLDWEELERSGQIDARLRFKTEFHRLAQLDDESMRNQVYRHAARFMTSDKSLWMGRDTYALVPLRERSREKIMISQDDDGRHHREHNDGPVHTVWLGTKVQTKHRLPNDWLAYSFEESLTEARRLGFSALEALSVELRDEEDDKTQIFHSESLGYFTE